jgi:hypothetical protein
MRLRLVSQQSALWNMVGDTLTGTKIPPFHRLETLRKKIIFNKSKQFRDRIDAGE